MCSAGTTLSPDMCPQRLGVASSRWMAATPGLLLIARADDVDGIAVTSIEVRAGKMSCLMLSVARALSRRKQGFRVP